ncbi:MAG TPA: helix-turn-helix domain-containing protein [Terrimicrobiaceae bacterium]|nr:helix-turn-helix domain-containing protein [Terrimicrobiaceae bacterium]
MPSERPKSVKEVGEIEDGRQTQVPAKRKRRGQSGLGRVDDGMLYVFSHPLRVRMIAELNEEDGSASDLAKRLSVKTYNADYHLKKLLEYDCVEVVRRERIRGTQKTIYRAKVKVEFPQEIWESLPASVQKLVVAAVFMTSSSDAQVALLADVFEKRPESHASWTNLKLDEEGWQKLVKEVDHVLLAAKEIEVEAASRLEDRDEDPLIVSLNLSGFVLPEGVDPVEARVAADQVREKVQGRRSLRHLVEQLP